ncbi:12971_t:CDS:2 [Ambispora gerdemannii]|uniref:12971_t:CDS:1 n=1 Tax=Ambispora gerdemannii TaxID=144530 RepID=A0A9N9DFX6_9GLOM|nr:12971_t:CDS:2 [Ambispora gerdemannii]
MNDTQDTLGPGLHNLFYLVPSQVPACIMGQFLTPEIYTTLTLSQAQTIATFILGAAGFGWFFFLSNAVKLKASSYFNNDKMIPILETIVPTSMKVAVKILHRTPIAFMVALGPVLTSFEGVIVLHTIGYVESCGTAIAKAQAQITNEIHRAAYWFSAEIEAMMDK